MKEFTSPDGELANKLLSGDMQSAIQLIQSFTSLLNHKAEEEAAASAANISGGHKIEDHFWDSDAKKARIEVT